jgi:hypothetical protein
MEQLRRWSTRNKTISIRVITGGAGSGKTRLALEFCDALVEHGWDAGFVTDAELTRFATQQNLSTWGWARPTLIVVDYAAARAQVLHRWLVELAENPGNTKKPLRVLLLERDADPEQGWWETALVVAVVMQQRFAISWTRPGPYDCLASSRLKNVARLLV